MREAGRNRSVEPVSAVVQPIAIIPTCGIYDFDGPNLFAKGYVAQHINHPVAFEAAMSATKPLAHVGGSMEDRGHSLLVSCVLPE
jgi:hypothetical protein